MTWIVPWKRTRPRLSQLHRSSLGVVFWIIAGQTLLCFPIASSPSHLPSEGTTPPASPTIASFADPPAADSATATGIRLRVPSVKVTVWEDFHGVVRWTTSRRSMPDLKVGTRILGELAIEVATETAEHGWTPTHRLMAFKDGNVISALVGSDEAQPIAGAQLDLYAVIPQSQVVHFCSMQTTGAHGTTSFDLSSLPSRLPNSDFRSTRNHWLLISRVSGEFDVAMLPEAIPKAASAILWTDRPAYARGETVHFQMLGLRGPPHAMLPAASEPIEIHVESLSPDTQVGRRAFASWETTLTTDSFGKSSGAFVLPPSVMEGDCTLSVTSMDANRSLRAHTSAQICAFAPASFELSVRAKKNEAIAGDTLEVEVTARTPQGLPVEGFLSCAVDQVEMYRQFRRPGSPISQGWYGPEQGLFRVNDLGARRHIATLDARLDAQGRATLRIPTPTPEPIVESHYTLPGLIIQIRADDGAGTHRTEVLEVPLFPGDAWCVPRVEGKASAHRRRSVAGRSLSSGSTIPIDRHPGPCSSGGASTGRTCPSVRIRNSSWPKARSQPWPMPLLTFQRRRPAVLKTCMCGRIPTPAARRGSFSRGKRAPIRALRRLPRALPMEMLCGSPSIDCSTRQATRRESSFPLLSAEPLACYGWSTIGCVNRSSSCRQGATRL